MQNKLCIGCSGKGKGRLNMPLEVQRESGCITPLMLNFGAGWGYVVNAKLRRLYRREEATIPIVQGYVSAPGPVRTVAPIRIRTVNRPASIESLYRRCDYLCVIWRRWKWLSDDWPLGKDQSCSREW